MQFLRYGVFSSMGGGSITPSTFTSGHTYSTGKYMWVYTPPNINPALSYPVIFSLGGDGSRSSDQNDVVKGSNDVSNEGIGYFLLNGDEPPDVFIVCVQIPSGDYSATDFDNAKSYMIANYPINANRVSVIGFSRGGFGCRVWAQSRATEIASTIVIAGNGGTGWNWSGTTGNGQSNIKHLWIQGTADGTVTNGQIGLLAQANAAGVNMNLPFETIALYGKDHEGYVWNTSCFNRKERTNATGTATFDYVRFLKRFSKDQTERCTLHVENAEQTLEIIDWRESRQLVDVMTGATKSSLLARLATVKSTIDAGGKRYVIDQGTSSLTTTGTSIYYCNNQTTHTTGAAISNLVDDEGGSSSIGLIFTSQIASSGRENSIASNRNFNKYFGYERSQNTDGATVQTTVTGGTAKFTGLNNSKLYNIRLFHSTASSFATNATIRVTIGGVTKTQYSECNNRLYIEYTNLSPASGEIIMAIRADADKNTFLTGLELFQQA
jgi:hypothetical protein